MAVVTGQAVVLKGSNGLGILLGSGPPTSSIGVDGQPGYLDQTNNLLYGPKVSGSWPSVGYQFGGNLLMYAGKPPDSYGAVGNLSLDISQGFIYGPRSATAWPAQPLLALVGPQGVPGPKGDTGAAGTPGANGTSPTLPNDYTANSLVIAPVSGDTNAVQVLVKNAAGTTLFSVDANGNVVGANGTFGNLTLASGGKFTFGDGTSMTTAASGTGSSSSTTGAAVDTMFMGTFYSTGSNLTTSYANFVQAGSAGSSIMQEGAAVYMPYAGSVVSIQGWVNLSTQGQTVTFCLYKNGVATNLTATTSNSSNAGATWSALTTSGTAVSFVAGDNLYMYLKSSGTHPGNQFAAHMSVQPQSAAQAATAASSVVVKSAIDMGGYYSTGASTGTYYTTKKQPGNAQTYTTTPVASDYVFKCPFACTILGWSVSQQQANAGNVTMQFWKNGTAPSNTITVSSNATGFFQGTVAANTYNYAAGDFIQVTTAISSGSAINIAVQLVVQWTDTGASSAGLVGNDPSFNSIKLAAVSGDTNPVALTFGDNTVQTTAFTGSATSATASRAIISGGSYYNSNTNTSYWTTVVPKINNTNGTAIGSTEYFFKAPFAFSLTGWTLNQYVANGSNTFQICKNRTSGSLNNILTTTAGNATVNGFPGNQFSGTYTKNLYNFAVGDVLSVVVAFSSGTSTNMDLQLAIEWL